MCNIYSGTAPKFETETISRKHCNEAAMRFVPDLHRLQGQK